MKKLLFTLSFFVLTSAQATVKNVTLNLVQSNSTTERELSLPISLDSFDLHVGIGERIPNRNQWNSYFSFRSWDTVSEIRFLSLSQTENRPSLTSLFTPVILRFTSGKEIPFLVLAREEVLRPAESDVMTRGGYFYTFMGRGTRQVRSVERISRVQLTTSSSASSDPENRVKNFLWDHMPIQQPLLYEIKSGGTECQVEMVINRHNGTNVLAEICAASTVDHSRCRQVTVLKSDSLPQTLAKIFQIQIPEQQTRNSEWLVQKVKRGEKETVVFKNGPLSQDYDLPFGFAAYETDALSLKALSFVPTTSRGRTVPVEQSVVTRALQREVYRIVDYVEGRAPKTEILQLLNEHIDWDAMLKRFAADQREEKRAALQEMLSEGVDGLRLLGPQNMRDLAELITNQMQPVEGMPGTFAASLQAEQLRPLIPAGQLPATTVLVLRNGDNGLRFQFNLVR